MDNPIKKKSLIPRMFRAFTFYFFITLAVFFGYVELFGGVKTIRGTLPDNGAQGEVDMSFSNFVTNMTSMQNIYIEGMQLNFDGAGMSVKATADIAVDMATKQVAINADVNINEHFYDVGVVYADPEIFISVDDKTYKFVTSTENGALDLSAVMGIASELSKNINVDLSGFNKIFDSLGIDLENLNMATLIDNLDISSKKSEGEVRISIIMFNRVEAMILCDEDCYMKSASVKGVNIGSNVLSIEVPKVEMNDNSISDKIEAPRDKELIDMSALTDYSIFTQDLLKNDYVDGDILVNVNGKEYSAKLSLVMKDGFKIRLTSNVEGVEVEVAYANDMIYLKADELRLSLAAKDFKTWQDKISAIIESRTSKTAADFVTEILKDYANIDVSNIDIEGGVKNVLGGLLSSSESMCATFPYKTVLTENDFQIMWKEGLTVTLEQKDNTLSALKVTYGDVNAVATFVASESGFDIDGEFYDVSKLLPLVDVVDSVSTAGAFGGKISVKFGENNIELDYVASLKGELVARFDIEGLGEKASLYVAESNVLLQVGSVVVEGTLDELDSYLEKINQIFGTEISLDANLSQIDKKQILGIIKELLSAVKLENGEENIIAQITYLSHNVEFLVDGKVATIIYSNGDLQVSMTVEASEEDVEVPTVTDSFDGLLEKIESVKAFALTKQYAFDLAVVYENYNLSANVRVDLLNKAIAVENLSYKDISLNVYYKDEMIFVDAFGAKFKMQAKTVGEVGVVLNRILKANGIDIFAQKIDFAEISTKLLGEDVTVLSVEDLLERIALSIDGSLDNLTVGVDLAFENKLSALANVKFDNNNLKSVELKVNSKLSANVEIVEFAGIAVSAQDYYDLTTAQSGQIILNVMGEEVKFDVELDLNGRVYFKAFTQECGLNVQILVLDNMLYATVGDLNFKTDFNNAKELYNYVIDLFGLVVKMPKLENVNSLNNINSTGLKASMGSETIKVEYANEKLGIALTLKNNATLSELVIPINCEDLKTVLPKVKNLIDYIDAGIFEFDFEASYNGFEFVGKLKYANGVIEIADVLAAGEKANIRIENKVVYFSYGNMKLKFDVPENNGHTDWASVQNMISKITSESMGVEIKFGVFEDLLNMLSAYSIEDVRKNIVVALNGNSNDIQLTVSKQKTLSLSTILTANIRFVDDKISSANVSLYDIVKVDVIVNNVTESTIKPFDPDDYKDYSDDFVAGALDSLEVVPNVYGFSSDIAIRYSKTTFYGELVAMMVKAEDLTAEDLGNGKMQHANIGGYIPAISIHTTSLGLNSYIYLIGDVLYIDINGLQIRADLSMTTINEILEFVETKFGIALAGEGNALANGMNALTIILPALDKIYGSWLTLNGQGVQIDIKDSLWYGKESYFDNIVLQAFITNSNNIIMPTKLIIGADIHDPNTKVYEDYSDAWLDAGVDENGEKIVIEDDITKKLNFGAYFTNISVGSFAESIDKVFVIKDRNYQDINSVLSNNGTTKLTDFNPYQTVLTLAETVYDYGMGFKYALTVGATVVDDKTKESMELGGNVVVAVDELKEGQSAVLDLFGGKSLKVQGNLELLSKGTRHLIDLLYSNVDEGLYFTYSHGANIGKNALKAKIANANMSEIISMIVKFANIDLGDSMKEAWNIDYCTTDFSYIQSLLGLDKKDIGDDISKADVALNSVESITKMLGHIKLEKSVDEETGLATITLSVEIKLDEKTAPAVVSIILKEEKIAETEESEVVVTKLKQITLEGLKVSGKTIKLTIDVNGDDAAVFNYNTNAEHIDFSNVSKLIDTIVTTANTKNFTFNGDVFVNLGGVAKINMWLDLYLNIDEIKNPYIFAQFVIDPSGLAGTVFNHSINDSLLDSLDKILVTYEYRNGALTFHRYSKGTAYDRGLAWKKYTKVVEESVSRNSYAKNEIMPNLTKIILDSMGVKETFLGINIPNMIKSIIANINVNPTIEEALIGFTTDADCVNTTIKLNGANLLGDGAENIDLNFGAVKYAGYTYDDKGNKIDKIYSCIDSITGLRIKMTGVEVSLNLNSINDSDSYKTTSYELKSSYNGSVTGNCGGRTLYTNRYYRTQYINTVGGLYAA